MKQVSAYDGKVVFHMVGLFTIKHGILHGGLEPLRSNVQSEELAYQMNTFILCVGSTADIEFTINEDDKSAGEIAALHEFWQYARNEFDAVALFNRFMLLPTQVSNVWQNARSEAIPQGLLASTELTAEGTTDPNLESVDETD